MNSYFSTLNYIVMNILSFCVLSCNIPIHLHITDEELSSVDKSPNNKAAYEGLFLYALNLTEDSKYNHLDN